MNRVAPQGVCRPPLHAQLDLSPDKRMLAKVLAIQPKQVERIQDGFTFAVEVLNKPSRPAATWCRNTSFPLTEGNSNLHKLGDAAPEGIGDSVDPPGSSSRSLRTEIDRKYSL